MAGPKCVEKLKGLSFSGCGKNEVRGTEDSPQEDGGRHQASISSSSRSGYPAPYSGHTCSTSTQPAQQQYSND